MDVKYYIPTRGRVGESKQLTLRELQNTCSVPAILVHPPGEKHNYWDHCVECPDYGIGPTREWILQNSSADIAIMADDDMYFYRRHKDSTSLEGHPNMDWFTVWVIEKVKQGYIHGGMSARQGNNQLLHPKHLTVANERIVGRVNNLHFFDVKAYREQLSGGFTTLPVMEDFFVTLSLLSKGFPNIITYDYAWNQRGSGTDGGCALYRTPKMQEEAANALREAFPKYVRVVTKYNYGDNVGSVFKEPRKDVVVQWRKAFESVVGKVSSYIEGFDPHVCKS